MTGLYKRQAVFSLRGREWPLFTIEVNVGLQRNKYFASKP